MGLKKLLWMPMNTYLERLEGKIAYSFMLKYLKK